MGGPTYSVDELQFLRGSPLVHKPDGLPSIEQWMEVPTDQTNTAAATSATANANRRPRSGLLRDGDTTATADSRTDRPMGLMGNFGRRQSTHPEDTVLGPPKLSFTSASRAAKAAETTERRGITSIDGDLPGDRFPSRGNDRWGRDRDNERKGDKAGITNGRRPGREEGEGWTSVKGRKSLGQEDFDRGFGRNGDRDREKHHKDGDAEATDAPARRAGAPVRDKFDRWARRDESAVKESEVPKFGATGQGGWRDRERDRGDRDKERDWTRGAAKIEEDPEWMDTPGGAGGKQAKTQEDFQRWKEQMKKGKDAPAEDKKDVVIESQAESPSAPEPQAQKPTFANPPSKLGTPLAVESGIFFGNWGLNINKTENENDPGMAPKPKAKASKFMQANLFNKGEGSLQNVNPPILPAPASPPPPETDEDKQGFQRILQMLGGTNISAPPGGPNGPGPTNGMRQGGLPLEFQHPSPPQDISEGRPMRQHVPRTLEQQAMLENILAPRPSTLENRPAQQRYNTISPETSGFEQFGLPRPDSNRPGDEYSHQPPPPRTTSAQDASLQALLNSRAREEAANRDQSKQRERDFLLTLMQGPARGTPPQPHLNQGLPRGVQENPNLPPFFDQGSQRIQGQPKGRNQLPPGFMEDPRAFENDIMMRREMERREAQIREANMREMQQQEAMRKSRLPMNFHDDPAIAGLQRRNTAGEIPRQLTNMGIPSQPVPDMQQYMRGNPGMPPTPNDRNIAPPPGFGGPAAMRQPPGFGGPQGGPSPLGHPPGIPPPRMMGGAPFLSPGAQMPPQGPPQGYFPPPGYGPPMGSMRGGEDPRMMMGAREFEQFGGPGQPNIPRQMGGGRPPNMY
ncbi:hypothetical protein P154DRAFT_77722 [Amniculicola lignicola CBS 123094]|uniref:Uncharacterized protein n=1 Tax=Amniculicola lignicola CBS 123094 TaxID=1392246 RepID=A0A6A5VZM7_9PLEO|nr:hypothetical protein P154DRAFT_77722 [Amniculicola lignicola CBS 123094]